MKKLYSLIRACMTNDMNLFKINNKNSTKSSKKSLPLLLSLFFMFAIWSNANLIFEKAAPNGLQSIVMSMLVFGVSLMTIIEGIYKSSSLMFNCKDDLLLLSLPIKRSTILFIRIFKFYIFELLFNSLFMIPVIFAYIRWNNSINYTYYLTNLIMLFMLPIIPIIISSIIGVIISSISSRFKYKNIAQIIISMLFILGIFYISFNSDNIINYLLKNATSINDLIIKIYYPAGVYANLLIKFNIIDLVVFVLINVFLFIIVILILSKFYFKINSRLKNITTNKKRKIKDIHIKRNSIYKSLIKKELNTFFKTPVFVINAGLGLLMYIIITIIISFKFDSILPLLTNEDGINLSKNIIMNNLSLLILILITITSYMTSITNSVISLEGRNINILKSLPIKTKTILLSKIYACLILTTPVLLSGNIILFIKFKINIIEALLLLVLSILIPLVSHFIGLIINLKYPKLDALDSTEIVKQSTSSFLSVMLGMILLIINITIIINAINTINSLLLLIITVILYFVFDIFLYLFLINKGVSYFNNLSV